MTKNDLLEIHSLRKIACLNEEQLDSHLNGYKQLLKKTKDLSIVNMVFEDLMKYYIHNSVYVKKQTCKIFKKNKKIFCNVDPLIYKTELMSNLKSSSEDLIKYSVKLILIFIDRFVKDFEIVTECLFKGDQKVNKKILNYDKHLSKTYYENIDLFKREYDPTIKLEFDISKDKDIQNKIDYLRTHNDVSCLKILIRNPILKRFLTNIDPYDSHFLKFKEAKTLYFNCKLYNERWNNGSFKIISWNDIKNTDEYFYKYLFLKKFLKNRMKEESIYILEELSSLDLKVDFKLIFQYFYNKLCGNNTIELLKNIELQNLQNGSEFKKLKKLVNSNLNC